MLTIAATDGADVASVQVSAPKHAIGGSTTGVVKLNVTCARTRALRLPRPNFLAEVEQVAFHVGHLVPGIDVTDDPLLQAGLFSYVDTQLSRLGGPNFNAIPVNRTHVPVNDMLRDGFH